MKKENIDKEITTEVYDKWKVARAFNFKIKYYRRGVDEFVHMAKPLLHLAKVNKLHEIWFSDSPPPEGEYDAWLFDSSGKVHKLPEQMKNPKATMTWISVTGTGVRLRVLFVLYIVKTNNRIKKNNNILVVNDPNISDDARRVVKQSRILQPDFRRGKKR